MSWLIIGGNHIIQIHNSRELLQNILSKIRLANSLEHNMLEINSWEDRAACKGMTTAVFFPHKEDNEHIARAICKNCPVKCECLEFALTHKIDHGIWGGLGVRSRSRIRRQRIKADATR